MRTGPGMADLFAMTSYHIRMWPIQEQAGTRDCACGHLQLPFSPLEKPHPSTDELAPTLQLGMARSLEKQWYTLGPSKSYCEALSTQVYIARSSSGL